MDNNYLIHWGIKGMKWGKRRYQNEDGTLTEEGKKRYDRDIRENNAKKKDNRITIDGPDADRWVSEDLRRTKKAVDGISSLNRDVKGVIDKIPSKKQQKLDLSKMSDKQLRDRINRSILEKQYNDMFAPKTVSKGRQVAEGIVNGVGTTLSIVGSSLAIAMAIKELKG